MSIQTDVTWRRIIQAIVNRTDKFPVDSASLPDPTMELSTIFEAASRDPETLFRYLLGTLVVIGVTSKAWPYLESYNWYGSSSKDITSKDDPCCKIQNAKSPEVLSLQKRYLPVFYLFRMSFWMSGPYFYQAYSSKMLRHIDGTTSMATSDFVARVSLVGYLAIVLLGPMVGETVDQYGRKTATICTGIMYMIGSLSVFSDVPLVLYGGRAVASIASSRLTSTPESWLIHEYLQIQKKRKEEKKKTFDCGLSETLGLAYGGDALVAILAGQTASLAASQAGHPTGPFLVSPLFVTGALFLIVLFWIESDSVSESKKDKDGRCRAEAAKRDEKASSAEECPMRAGAKAIFSDPKILLIGLIQSLFEGSMYIFVLVWPPILSNSIKSYFGPSASIPYGTIFSCFMACCLVGSVLFGQLQKMCIDMKHILSAILLVSTLAFSWSVRAVQTENLFAVITVFFAFEACVGMYFPSIGTIRSKLLPDKHRCAIRTLFAVPLNALVVGVICFQPRLGDVGSLTIAGFAMGIATMCMLVFYRQLQKEKPKNESRWKKIKKIIQGPNFRKMCDEMKREAEINNKGRPGSLSRVCSFQTLVLKVQKNAHTAKRRNSAFSIAKPGAVC